MGLIWLNPSTVHRGGLCCLGGVDLSYCWEIAFPALISWSFTDRGRWGCRGRKGSDFIPIRTGLKIGECSGPRSRRKELILGGQGINLPKVGDFDAGLRLSATSGRRGVGERGYSGVEKLVRWAGIAIEDEDAFVIEQKLRGFSTGKSPSLDLLAQAAMGVMISNSWELSSSGGSLT